MHDAKGRQLKKGDLVMVPAIITDLQETPDYCNVTVQALFPRRPDNMHETYCLNTGYLLKADSAVFEEPKSHTAD